jgi:hypothetical protein
VRLSQGASVKEASFVFILPTFSLFAALLWYGCRSGWLRYICRSSSPDQRKWKYGTCEHFFFTFFELLNAAPQCRILPPLELSATTTSSNIQRFAFATSPQIFAILKYVVPFHL